jgi:DNA-directed RNA polymerase subunit RPC12/RpoP
VLSVERLLMGTSPQEAIVHTASAGSGTAQPSLPTGEDFPCTYCKGRMLYPDEGGGSFNCSHCDKPFVIVRCPDCREMRGIQTDHGMKCWRCGHEIPTGR